MIIALLSICLTVVAPLAHAAPSAPEILNDAGIRGGLIVHLGCANGRLTAALRANESCLVHGLDTNPRNVESARAYLLQQGLHGKATVDAYDGERLPFIDSVVNLIVVSSAECQVPRDEMLRVLAPGGVVYDARSAPPSVTRKPRPEGMDEWTHFLRSADNNAVSRDRTGPPRTLQWQATPVWARHHDKQASISALVTSNGRLFYIADRGSVIAPDFEANWFLEARDAFNGVLLWQKPMESWVSHMRRFRSGPVQLARLLVADGDDLYATMGIGAPVSVLDGATGGVRRALEATQNAEEMVLDEGVLLCVLGVDAPEHAYAKNANYRKKALVALDPSADLTLWRWPAEGARDIVPQTLAAVGNSVFLQDGVDTVCLRRWDGRERWRVKTFEPAKPKQTKKGKSAGNRSPGWAYATLVVKDGVVLSGDGKVVCALSADDGTKLWECPAKTPFGRVPSVDILVIDGVVWTSPTLTEGRDLHTGKVVKKLDLAETLVTAGHHHRCYRNKGVGDFLIYGYRGMDFFDTKGEAHSRNNWIRGQCQYGVMPANGLHYVPPHNCGCYPEALLHGFFALADERRLPSIPDDFRGRFERTSDDSRQSQIANPKSSDWPLYRRDAARSGVAGQALPTNLHPAWQADLGGQLTPPVVGEGVVILARKDDHTVHALDERTGKPRWTFTPGGMVDSAPTVHAGRVLFGATDGCVYCLGLRDGRLLWRFHAVPADLNTVVMGRVESLWPVHGSVLVKDGIAYFAAGRSTYLDGGLFLYGIDAQTGDLRHFARLAGEYPGRQENTAGVETKSFSQNKIDFKTLGAADKSDAFSMEGNTSDIMTADGDSVYLRHMRFADDLTRQTELKHHLFSTSKLLDDNEAHRSHWFYGNGDFSGLNVAYEWITRGSYGGFSAPFGTLLVFDDATVWGVTGHEAKGVAFASPIADIDQRLTKDFPAPKGRKFPDRIWQQPLTMHPRALLKAGPLLYLGGAASTEQLLSGEGGVIQVKSASDGTSASQLELTAPPVFDGMAAANGKLFVSQSDGTLVCLSDRSG